MTKLRRRLARLALQLQQAGIEPVFVGCSYREMQAGLMQQWSELTSSRRKAAKQQVNCLISDAKGLKNAADHLVPRPLQQTSTGSQTPIHPSHRQIPPSPLEAPRCSVCRTRFGLPKRSFPSHAAAWQLCERQKDPGLVVYACPLDAGVFHLGHPSTTPRRREPHRVDEHVAAMLPTPLHQESPMKRSVSLANPFLITIYSASLVLIGCGVRMHWTHTPETALWPWMASGVLMAAHDSVMAILFFWLTARWARSVIERSKDL